MHCKRIKSSTSRDTPNSIDITSVLKSLEHMKNTNPDADLSQVLKIYEKIFEENNIHLTRDARHADFTKVALLLHGTAEVYGRKVDRLWSLFLEQKSRLSNGVIELSTDTSEDSSVVSTKSHHVTNINGVVSRKDINACKLITGNSDLQDGRWDLPDLQKKNFQFPLLRQNTKSNKNLETPRNMSGEASRMFRVNKCFDPDYRILSMYDNELLLRYSELHSPCVIQSLLALSLNEQIIEKPVALSLPVEDHLDIPLETTCTNSVLISYANANDEGFTNNSIFGFSSISSRKRKAIKLDCAKCHLLSGLCAHNLLPATQKRAKNTPRKNSMKVKANRHLKPIIAALGDFERFYRMQYKPSANESDIEYDSILYSLGDFNDFNKANSQSKRNTAAIVGDDTVFNDVGVPHSDELTSWHQFMRSQWKQIQTDANIHDYCSEIVDTLNVGETRKFATIAGNKSRSDMARYFMATLHLASSGTVDYVDNHNEDTLGLSVKLLNKEKFFDTIHHFAEFNDSIP